MLDHLRDGQQKQKHRVNGQQFATVKGESFPQRCDQRIGEKNQQEQEHQRAAVYEVGVQPPALDYHAVVGQHQPQKHAQGKADKQGSRCQAVPDILIGRTEAGVGVHPSSSPFTSKPRHTHSTTTGMTPSAWVILRRYRTDSESTDASAI